MIAFFEGMRSERQLMETVKLNLAHRWYIGYDLDEPVPNHNSLSKIRERYGLETFHWLIHGSRIGLRMASTESFSTG